MDNKLKAKISENFFLRLVLSPVVFLFCFAYFFGLQKKFYKRK
jgi:hypothetical protein